MSSLADQGVVFYSSKDKTWKVTDFGLVASGTLKRAETTYYSRCTSGYRLLELLSGYTNSTFNNKVDISAIRCVVFELLFLERGFLG